jgi:hypothetical protein
MGRRPVCERRQDGRWRRYERHLGPLREALGNETRERTG